MLVLRMCRQQQHSHTQQLQGCSNASSITLGMCQHSTSNAMHPQQPKSTCSLLRTLLPHGPLPAEARWRQMMRCCCSTLDSQTAAATRWLQAAQQRG
jgi:hypothetical protein